MYDASSQQRLKERADYELWLLRYLSEREGCAKGRCNHTWTFRNRRPEALTQLSVSVQVGAGLAQSVFDAIATLRFTAAYKLLDVVVEWVLEENKQRLGLSSVPWRFKEKVGVLRMRGPNIVLPPFLDANRDIAERVQALYCELLDFRNEVVHRHSFSTGGGGLTVSTSGASARVLAMTPADLAMLVESVLLVTEALASVASIDTPTVKRLRYALDQLTGLHHLSPFGQMVPVVWKVFLKVDEEDGTFPADLEFLRAQLARQGVNREILLDLYVVGVSGGAPAVCWHFGPDEEPKVSLLRLQRDTDTIHRVAAPDPAEWDFPVNSPTVPSTAS